MACAVIDEVTGEVLRVIAANPNDTPYPGTILVSVPSHLNRDPRDFVYDKTTSEWNLKSEFLYQELAEETRIEDEGLVF